MIVTDASAWISYFLAEDVNHAESLSWFERVATANEEMVAPRFLLLEVVAAIARRSGDPATGRHFAERLLRHPRLRLVSMTDELIDASASVGAQLRLRGADAIYIATATAHDARLVTWDREQLERGSALVPTATPADDLAAEPTDS